MKTPLMFIALMWLLLISCAQKRSDYINPDNYFPNSIGNKFTYRVVDSVSHKTYDVNVSVVGTTTLPNGKQATLWTYAYPNSMDTNYVFSNKDSAVFYDKSKTAIVNLYHFPLTIGAQWKYPYFGPYVSSVISVSPLQTQSATFSSAYLIKEIDNSPNTYITKNKWYVPMVGLVKMSIGGHDPGSGFNQLWELRSYTLNSNN